MLKHNHKQLNQYSLQYLSIYKFNKLNYIKIKYYTRFQL